MSQQDLQGTLTDDVIARLQSDAGFCEQLKDDPNAALLRTGVSSSRVEEVIRAISGPASIGAYEYDPDLGVFDTIELEPPREYHARGATCGGSMCDSCGYASAAKKCGG
jgi:hypothetical protein